MIRPIEPRDMDDVVDVRTSVIENHMSVEAMAERGITREVVLADLASGELGGWVVEADGRVVAFAMARHSDGSIFALFTLPRFESRGFGTTLLEECLRWLRQRGHKEAWLSTGRDTRAEAFYRKRGWKGDEQSDVFPEDVVLRTRL